MDLFQSRQKMFRDNYILFTKSNSVPCLFVPALYDKAYDKDFAFVYKL